MNFLNPLVLFGLFAAAIPVLLHLLNLRKLKTIEFSSLKFLKELQKTKIRKLKLKQILLLILRTLIIIFAVLAFARPTIPGSIPYFETYSKTSAIILLDNSYSMDISDEFGNRFNQLKQHTNNILSTLGEGDEVAIIPMSETGNFPSNFSRNFEYINSKLNELKISLIPANLNRSLRKAEQLLGDAINVNKEIYIISDAQENVFRIINNDTVKLKSLASNILFIPIGIGSKADLQNISVDSVKINSRIFQKDKIVETEAFVRNNSKNTINDIVVGMSFNNASVAQRSADIASGETKSFLISAAPMIEGQIKAKIEIESDIQDMDNSKYFGFTIPPMPNILIISDEDNTFLKIALSSLKNRDNSNNLKFINPTLISGENLPAYDALIINSGNISKSNLTRVSQYILNGGSAFIFATDVLSNDLRDFLLSLSISNIEDIKFSNASTGSFSNIDKDHPIFEGVFDENSATNLQIESPKILKAKPAQSARSIISIKNGAFLAESNKGDGKLIYCAVAPNNEWSNFPLTGLFPTLIYRSILYLTSTQDLSTEIVSGNPYIFKLPTKFSKIERFKLSDPNGNISYYQAVSLPNGNIISFENLIIPGIYTLTDDNDKYISQLAVNPDISESDLASINTDKLKSILEDRFLDIPVSILKNNQELKSGINRVRAGTELWQIFILLSLISAIIEMIVQRTSKSELGEG